MKLTLEEIEKNFSSPITPELCRESMNNLLVNYNSFQNISTRYIVSRFDEEPYDYYPFTKTEPPGRIAKPPKNIQEVENVYKNLVSEGTIPRNINIKIKTVHSRINQGRANDQVITFIQNGSLENFLNTNYKLQNMDNSVKVLSTTIFGKPRGMLTMSNIEVKYKEEAKRRLTTPIDIAFKEGYVCVVPSGKILISPHQILRATKELIQNPYKVV